MKKSNAGVYFKWIFGTLFIIFMSLFIALESGYYDAKIREKIVLTEGMIQEFEADLAKGNPIDIKNYVVDDYIDYSNNASRAGMKMSHGVESAMTTGITEVFKFLGKIFT